MLFLGILVACNNVQTKTSEISISPIPEIKKEIFIEQLNEINKSGIEFINFKKFEEVIKSNLDSNYLLLTIDDAFESFYINAWPILKSKKISIYTFY